MLHEPSERPDLDEVRMRLLTDGGYLTLNQTKSLSYDEHRYLPVNKSEALEEGGYLDMTKSEAQIHDADGYLTPIHCGPLYNEIYV